MFKNISIHLRLRIIFNVMFGPILQHLLSQLGPAQSLLSSQLVLATNVGSSNVAFFFGHVISKHHLANLCLGYSLLLASQFYQLVKSNIIQRTLIGFLNVAFQLCLDMFNKVSMLDLFDVEDEDVVHDLKYIYIYYRKIKVNK